MPLCRVPVVFVLNKLLSQKKLSDIGEDFAKETRKTLEKTLQKKRASPSRHSVEYGAPSPPPPSNCPRATCACQHPPSPPRSTTPSQPIPPSLGPSYHVPSRLLASSASSRSVRPPCPATGRPPGPRHAASESRPWPRPCSGSWACPAPACRWQREASDRWSVSESTGHLPSLWGRQPTTLGEEASHPGAA